MDEEIDEQLPEITPEEELKRDVMAKVGEKIPFKTQVLIAFVFIIILAVGGYFFMNPRNSEGPIGETPLPPPAMLCSTYPVDECPVECVVCPPCEICSSISCQSEVFCADLGIDRQWYEDIQNRLLE